MNEQTKVTSTEKSVTPEPSGSLLLPVEPEQSKTNTPAPSQTASDQYLSHQNEWVGEKILDDW